MPGSRPLPRSLDPLPGESLPGYLLRLAHRLSLTPTRLAALTGLANDVRFPSWLSASTLLQLPDTARETFARATRLTRAEVDKLSLNHLSSRYPIPEVTSNSERPPIFRPDRWLLLSVIPDEDGGVGLRRSA